MSLFSMKFNSGEMFEMLESGLRPGETLIAAAYCAFHDTGFLASNRTVQTGYIGLSDSGRLFGIRAGFISAEHFSFEIAFLQKIRIKKMLFGARTVDIDGPEGRLKFVINRKIAGSKFPDQPENFEKIISELEYKQSSM